MIRLVAHRGYSAKYPENTMAAFEAAFEAGVSAIELDVHISARGVPVVVHDSTLPDGRKVWEVADPPLDQLRDVAAWARRRSILLFVELKKESIEHAGLHVFRAAVDRAMGETSHHLLSFVPDVGLEVGRDIVEIDKAKGGEYAAYTAQTANEVRLLNALGVRHVWIDDCGLAKGLKREGVAW